MLSSVFAAVAVAQPTDLPVPHRQIELRACPPYDASQGLGAGPYTVRARGISCHGAKRIARNVIRHGNDSVPGWRCGFRPKGPEGSVTTCRHRAQIVRFFAGS
jgi:hypothetical protein